ncbi:MAG: Co2+/Mg2+ efflux protein ApaG [Gammaproteobacteria bacterium]|nr:Co2+/Mg2+ efflux protein ApaG [Gammaproteobacteria bacterium]
MTNPDIQVSAISEFVPQQSDASNNRYVYSYTITIKNNSDQPYQLLSRHWLIQDGNMKVEEIYGDGVIGEQPKIKPGDSYSYSSGAVLETDIGTMEGRYFFKPCFNSESSVEKVEIAIPKFLLSIPRIVH